MAFADTSLRTVVAMDVPMEITLAGAAHIGDLLGDSSGWKQAAASSSAPIAAELIAMEHGASGEKIRACARGYVAGVSGGTAGADVFLSSTAGAYASSANGTVRQVVGFMVTATEMFVDPMNAHGVLEVARTTTDTRASYNRLFQVTTGGDGEALRAYTTVLNVAAANAHGAHLSLDFGTSGTVGGQGIATRSTLHIPSTAWTGNQTWAALQAEIWSDAATSDPGGAGFLSALRIVNAGNSTGMADVDTDCAAIEFEGWTAGSGKMLYGSTVRVRVDETSKYLVLSTAQDSLTLPAPITVGVDGTGYDVTFYGDTASSYLLWDQSADQLYLTQVASTNASTAFSIETTPTCTTAGVRQGAVNIYVDRTSDYPLASWDGNPDCGLKMSVYNRATNGANGGTRGLDINARNRDATGSCSWVNGAYITAENSTGSGGIVSVTGAEIHAKNNGVASGDVKVLRLYDESQSGTGTSYALEITCTNDSPFTREYCMYINSGASSGWTNGLTFDGNITNALDFADVDGTNGATYDVGGYTASNLRGKIKIDIGGTTLYIPAYATIG